MESKEDYRENLYNDELCLLCYLDQECKGEFVSLTEISKGTEMGTWTLSRIFNRYEDSFRHIAYRFGFDVEVKRGDKGNITSVSAVRFPSFYTAPYDWYMG